MSTSHERYPMPFVRVELVVLGILNGVLSVLLAKRSEAPFAGCWGLPGGVLRIDLDQDLRAAAGRVARERLSVELARVEQLGAVGARGRDPRAPWALSVVYVSLLRPDLFEASPGKRVETLQWHPCAKLPAARNMAFDHAELIRRAVQVEQAAAQRLDLPIGLLPDSFTLGELQATFESILGRPLDKSSFRRRLADLDRVVAVEGEMRIGPNRPAQIYRAR